MSVRDRRQGGWFWLDNETLDKYGAELGAYGISVYNVLCRYADNASQKAFPGVKHIAAVIGCSERQVQYMLRRLETLGLIGIRAVTTSTGDFSHNEYVLQRVKAVSVSFGGGERDAPPGAPGAGGGARDASYQDLIIKDSQNGNDVLWRSCLGELREQMTGATFDTWLVGSQLVSLDGGAAVVRVRDAYAVEWCQDRLASPITRTLRDVAGVGDVQIEFVGGDDAGGGG